MSENNPPEEITLLTDEQWGLIEEDVCRVIDFNPMCSFKGGKIVTLGMSVPYASVSIECSKAPKIIKGFITHKVDFIHLWKAFKERTIKEDEEVIIGWTKRRYKHKLPTFLSRFFPRLIVMICPKDAFKLMTDKNYKPELQGEARFLAEKPIVEWKPDVMM